MQFDKMNPQVFLVEDSSDDEELAIRGLNKHLPSAIIKIARDGRQALNLVRTESPDAGLVRIPPPSLVLLDLKLPYASGFEVLSAIRASATWQTVPVVVFSSSDEVKDVTHAYKLGANCFVQKPVDYERYYPAIQQIVSFWFRLVKLPSQEW